MKGSIVLLQLPQNLFKMSPNEKETMQQFWQQEKKRVMYVRERFETRQEEQKDTEMIRSANADDITEDERKAMEEQNKKLQLEYKKKYEDFMNEFFNEEEGSGSEEA
jgi:hypothetical protein